MTAAYPWAETACTSGQSLNLFPGLACSLF